MYFIHPNHVHVNLPKDCTDDELILGEDKAPINESTQPTGMSFFLERVRLARLCREMADTVPLNTSKLMQMPYEQIMSLDAKFQDYISSLPFFFKLDAESLQRSKSLETIYPRIHISRYCITTEAHTRRCKLHQKFLHRQSRDPRYAYSRQACLESARAVVHGYRGLQQHESGSIEPELMGIAVHFTHLALVVMVMDLCFNRDEADEAEVRAEVKSALQMFKDARNASPLLAQSLTSLSDVLRQHKVHLADQSITANSNSVGLAPDETMCDAFNDPSNTDQQLGLVAEDPGVTYNTQFEYFWQSALVEELNTDTLSWDNLFSALDSRPL